MDKNEAISFFFNLAREIKRSFESPVILVTSKDYAQNIFVFMKEFRAALLENVAVDQVVLMIKKAHQEWLQAVLDIEQFKKIIKVTPRDVLSNAIDFTINCTQNRYKHFSSFIKEVRLTLTLEERIHMEADLEAMHNLQESMKSVLLDKKKCFLYQSDNNEYFIKVAYEIEELLNWLDKLNDCLAIQFSKINCLNIPQLSNDLTKTLKEIIDEVTASCHPDAQQIVKAIEREGLMIGSMVRISSCYDIEIGKIVEKIKTLENRISRLKKENSMAVLAMQHKLTYLEERLQSLEDLRLSLNALKYQENENIDGGKMSENEMHIFNHNLPADDRRRLVEKFMKLWDNALKSAAAISTISILSAADMNEVHGDDFGHFTIDKYGRKLYKQDNDSNVYQLNANNELVKRTDDQEHVYFYAKCGRYFINETNNLIYKAFENASEYLLDHTGKMVLLKETRNGVDYMYDHIVGQYYEIGSGKRVYCDIDTGEKYDLDEFGNLVRINKNNNHVYQNYPLLEKTQNTQPVTKDSKYLHYSVGEALKKCIANVILSQPTDPIKLLADNLEKYWENLSMKQKRLDKTNALQEMRDYYMTIAPITSSSSSNTTGLISFYTNDGSENTQLDISRIVDPYTVSNDKTTSKTTFGEN